MSQEQFYQTVQQGEQYFEDTLKSNLSILEKELEYYQWKLSATQNTIFEIQSKINQIKEKLK